jgi:chitodextrinase
MTKTVQIWNRNNRRPDPGFGLKGPPGDWLPSVFSGDSQRISFTGFTPGTTYTIQVRALGGSTGQSDWSDPSSHMSM